MSHDATKWFTQINCASIKLSHTVEWRVHPLQHTKRYLTITSQSVLYPVPSDCGPLTSESKHYKLSPSGLDHHFVCWKTFSAASVFFERTCFDGAAFTSSLQQASCLFQFRDLRNQITTQQHKPGPSVRMRSFPITWDVAEWYFFPWNSVSNVLLNWHDGHTPDGKCRFSLNIPSWFLGVSHYQLVDPN